MTINRKLIALLALALGLGLGGTSTVLANPAIPSGDYTTCVDLDEEGHPECEYPDDPEEPPVEEPDPGTEDPPPAEVDDPVVADPNFTG
jgi:hypothetical protein